MKPFAKLLWHTIPFRSPLHSKFFSFTRHLTVEYLFINTSMLNNSGYVLSMSPFNFLSVLNYLLIQSIKAILLLQLLFISYRCDVCCITKIDMFQSSIISRLLILFLVYFKPLLKEFTVEINGLIRDLESTA